MPVLVNGSDEFVSRQSLLARTNITVPATRMSSRRGELMSMYPCYITGDIPELKDDGIVKPGFKRNRSTLDNFDEYAISRELAADVKFAMNWRHCSDFFHLASRSVGGNLSSTPIPMNRMRYIASYVGGGMCFFYPITIQWKDKSAEAAIVLFEDEVLSGGVTENENSLLVVSNTEGHPFQGTNGRLEVKLIGVCS